MAKADTTDGWQITIYKAHNQNNADKKPAASIKQLSRNTAYGMCKAIKRAANQPLTNKKQVWFKLNVKTHHQEDLERANMVHTTYNSRSSGAKANPSHWSMG